MTVKLPKDFVDRCNSVANNAREKRVATKVCSCCGKTKPLDEFYKQSYTELPTDQCKVCINVKRSVVRHKAKHGKFLSKERQRSMEEPNYTLADWRDAMVHFGGECCYCGVKEGRSKKTKFDREHLVPISKGGKTIRNNIACACPKCNRSRGNKNLVAWYREQPFWTQEREDRIMSWIYQEVDDE